MRFTITPLGASGGRSVSAVVGDIVRYLQGPQPGPSAAGQSPPGTAGPSQYYADGSSEPGHWLGNASAEAGLVGTVDDADFARVLAGRDPHTGARLISAQGSAGRCPTLGRGTQTRAGDDGAALYDIRDAAGALRITPAEAEDLVAAGEAYASAMAATLLGGRVALAPVAGSYLLPVIDTEGTRWVPETELARCEDARCVGTSADEVAAAGAPDDVLSLADAARLAGVSVQYLRSVCRRSERAQEASTATSEELQAKRPQLRSYRGTRRQWLVKRADLVEYLRRRTPPAVRVGYDLTLTTEKSLGVLALLGGNDTRDAVLDAIQAGNDRGMAHLEYAAAMARAKGGVVSTRGFLVASFRHLTSRALDPFPHHHNVVANSVVDPDGAHRAVDGRFLYLHAGEASALATAEMHYQLTTTLGVGWRRGRKGGWEIDGIPDEVVREFSRRSREVEEAVAELETLIGRTTSIAELRGVVTNSRPAKRHAPADDLAASWWRRAQALGFEPEHLDACTSGPALPSPGPDPEVVFAALVAPDGLCEGGSIFTRTQVLAAIVDLDVPDGAGSPGPLIITADEVERLADDFLASDLVVQLFATEGRAIAGRDRQELFTTAEMLRVQERVLDRFGAGRSAGAATVSADVVDATLVADEQLSGEQRALVRALCTSGHRVQCAVGRAGAGKTTAMRAAVAAWRAGGYRVLGTAVKGEAARHLGVEAGIESETLAWLLAHDDPGDNPLDARTVLVVDEASTVSDRDLDRLLWLAEATGAAVRLIGDSAQHGAVGAGGMFGVLCTHGGADTPELRQTHRVRNPYDHRAAEAMRDGRIADAFAALEAAGHLHVVAGEVDLYLDVLERWWLARVDGAGHPMVDRRNRTRRQLNRLAHRLLQATGEIGTAEIEASDGRAFSVGDRVVARVGERKLHPAGRPADYVRNGAVGTVAAIARGDDPVEDAIRVDFDGLGLVELPRSYFDEHGEGRRRRAGLDLAYAMTSYAVQGATFAESTSRIDEKAGRAETYVDITRGRSANHLYLTRGIDPLDGEHLPKAPPPPVRASVADRLSRSGPERAAIDLDPDAPAAARARDGRPLAALRPDLVAADELAARLRDRQVRRTAAHALGPDVLEELPPRSDVPLLAHQWDGVVGDLAVFHARWGPSPGGSERWDWALGRRAGGEAMAAEREELARRVAELAVATSKEVLRAEGTELPAWAATHLAANAAAGRCSYAPGVLSQLYERIAAYRDDAGVADEGVLEGDENAVLGALPEDPVLRARRRALAAEAFPPVHVARSAERRSA